MKKGQGHKDNIKQVRRTAVDRSYVGKYEM